MMYLNDPWGLGGGVQPPAAKRLRPGKSLLAKPLLPPHIRPLRKQTSAHRGRWRGRGRPRAGAKTAGCLPASCWIGTPTPGGWALRKPLDQISPMEAFIRSGSRFGSVRFDSLPISLFRWVQGGKATFHVTLIQL